MRDSARFASLLLAGAADLEEQRVAYLVPPGYSHVLTQWGIWRGGGIAVPLALTHPRPELEHSVDDSGSSILVAHPDLRHRLEPLARDRGLRLLTSVAGSAGREAMDGTVELPEVGASRRALLLYTSGTTGRPKGVVLTFAHLEAQVSSLIEAWGWRQDDRILHPLPLHHLHGIVNILLCALWAGATCEILPRFDAKAVWESMLTRSMTLFMAVPTIYVRLIAAWEEAPVETRRAWSQAASELRLMVSGSAALPVAVLDRWREITGHVLLERYGMTEIGMALSNPLVGERVPGSVGRPLPGVEVRLMDEDGRECRPGEPGEIEVRGPGVFQEYWRRPEETREAFHDGWFRTGDLALLENGVYRILGRACVDILKSGGYKISALEIEEVLRQHPRLVDCAVVGVEDPEWGQRVCAAVIRQPTGELTAEGLCDWARGRLAAYKVPRQVLFVDALPRNSMGKVTKRDVAELFGDG